MFVVGSQAKVLYVSTSGSDSNSGNSWDQAFATIQHAINQAADGDEIWVQRGTYYENILMRGKPTIAIYGGFVGTETARNERDWIQNETIVNGGNSGTVFYIWGGGGGGGTITLDGLTITNGNNYIGGGIGVTETSSSKVIIRHCKITGNSANTGGGISIISANVEIIDSFIFNNSVTADTALTAAGGGVFVESGGVTFKMINSIVWNNSAHSSKNDARGGGIYFNVFSSQTPTVTNCVIYGNSADTGGGIYNLGNNIPEITNTIIRENSSNQIDFDNNGHKPIVTYSNVYGGYTGTGNIDEDPGFVNPAEGDFHLLPDSSCIDRGTNSAPGIPSEDFEGDNRIVDGNSDGTAIVDMGADEYTPPRSVTAVPVHTPGGLLLLAFMLGVMTAFRLKKSSIN